MPILDRKNYVILSPSGFTINRRFLRHWIPRCITKAVPVPSGEILFVIYGGIETENSDENLNFLCYFIPVFFDSRRDVYVNKDGEVIEIEGNFVADWGMQISDFILSPEGTEKLKRAYPADI